MCITILDLARHRLGLPPLAADDNETEGEPMTGADFDRAGLAILGGCAACGASIAAYNAAPTKGGYWMCAKDCAEGRGFATVEEANRAIFDGAMPGDDPPPHNGRYWE